MNDELWKKIKKYAQSGFEDSSTGTSVDEDAQFALELVRALVGVPITDGQIKDLVEALFDGIVGNGITGRGYSRNLDYLTLLRDTALEVSQNNERNR